MPKKSICCVIGTRPEAIKMAPVILDLQRREWAQVTVICTSQHRDIVFPILDLFGIEVDHDLDVMAQNPGSRLADRQAPPGAAALAEADQPRPCAGAGRYDDRVRDRPHLLLPVGPLRPYRSRPAQRPCWTILSRRSSTAVACDLVSTWHFRSNRGRARTSSARSTTRDIRVRNGQHG